MRIQHKAVVAALAISCGAANFASADTVNYWGYPSGPPSGAPGGNTFTHVSGTGAINPGGSTNQYAGFHPSSYTDLYWVVDTVAGAPVLGQSNTDTLSFDAARSNLAGGIIVFDNTYTLNTAFGTQSFFGELKATVTDTTLNPLSLDSPVLHTGMAPADGAALHVTGPYDVNLQFLMAPNSASSLQDASTYYNNLHANGTLQSSVSGGFYVAPVPLPAAAWLLLSGIGGLGLFGRRKPVE